MLLEARTQAYGSRTVLDALNTWSQATSEFFREANQLDDLEEIIRVKGHEAA
jgi:hypothetical protein